LKAKGVKRMLFKWLYIYFLGSVDIIVQGFFIERFINICKTQNIVLWSSKVEGGTILTAKISKSDFKKIRHIAKKTYCKVSIDSKDGLPFLLKRYKKRKIFAIAMFVIAIFCVVITRFIWNIDISGNEKLSKEEVLSDLAENGIYIGKMKMNLNLDEIKNAIQLKRDELSWIGIDIKGTNVIVTVEEAIEEPEIIDEENPSNIIADKSGTISKMIVRSGTARKNVRRYCFRRGFVS